MLQAGKAPAGQSSGCASAEMPVSAADTIFGYFCQLRTHYVVPGAVPFSKINLDNAPAGN